MKDFSHSEEQVSIREIFFAFKKNKKIFFLSFIVFSSLVAISQLVFLRGKKITYYEARGSVGFGNFSYLPAIMQKLGIDIKEITPDLEFESKVILSDEVLGRAFDIVYKKENSDYSENYGEKKKRFIREVRSNLSISKDHKEKVINLVLTWRKKDEAPQILNAILDAYNEYSQERFKNEVSKAVDMVGVALSHIEEILAHSYLDFATFSAKTGIIDAKYQVKLIFDSLQNLKDKLRSVDVRINVLKNSLSDIEQRKKIDADNIFALSDIEGFQKIYEEYNSLQIKREELLSQYTEKHPKIVAIDNQINSIVERMRRIISFEIKRLQLEREAILQEIDQINQTILNLSSSFVDYIRKRDKIDLINSLFYNYYEGFMSATLLGGVRFSMISQINKAEFANVRTSGGNKLSWIIFISALVGLVGGFVSIYISEVLDMKFRSIEEVENLIPAPVLGTLPKFSESDKASYLSFEHGIDGVRTNIELLSMRKSIIVLCFSSIPGEGKTTISLHLAKSFVNAGKRVLLVDLDLRHKSLSNLFGFINSPGFVDAVTYDMKLDNVVKEIENNFYFLPCGSHHPSPSAFLSHQKVKDFIPSLKEKFDYVILDSSPISAVYDILNIIHLSDFNLLVVGVDRVSKVQVKRVSTIINQIKAKIDGVVLSFVDEKVFPYISYYVNKYTYYYYYSGSEKTEGKKS